MQLVRKYYLSMPFRWLKKYVLQRPALGYA
jgi:hypothetical protein